MTARSTRAALVSLALLLAAAAPPAAGAAAGPAFACNRDSTLTLLGLDTTAGLALFAAPPAREHEPSWLIEIQTRTGEAGEATGAGLSARYRATPDGPRPFAGSIGPGPVFAARRCGGDCLQPVRYEGGAWRPLGEPIAADGATVHTTYDRSGRPWVVLHRPATRSAAAAGELEATAYRLGAGQRWEPRGTLAVRAAGAVGAAPDPAHADAVLSGTGRFSATAPPQPWVSALPKLPGDRRGGLVPAGEGAAALLDTSYALYTTADGGESWQRQLWTPWGSPRARLWEPGRDYWLDLPAYDRSGPLALAWFDRRRRDEPRLILSAWLPDGGWRTVASLPPETRTLDGAVLAFDHFLRPAPGSWVLLTGCVLTASGPGLGVRTVDDGEASSPRFLPLRPAGPRGPSGG